MMHSSPDNDLLNIQIHPPIPLTKYHDTCEEIPEISIGDRTENANVEVETSMGDGKQRCDVAREIQVVDYPDNNLLDIQIHPPTPLIEYNDKCEEIPKIYVGDRTENANVEVETSVDDRKQRCDVASEI
ncbi:hypothetical protein LOK49_LG05G03780 [Camellia lanceoleosa]|uniref:Uncharacterized protein n=1 Tax=Camellia lanceoleosa TaxID=1840588 RepID=A0ACC0HNH3_9ERIC|nr:hypothetical protein LOK49_LG05G03780 [Camellia lanceoleosa]